MSTPPRRPLRVLGYVRVSTREQGDTRLGLDAQRHALTSAAERHGWSLIEIRREVASGRSLDRRPVLADLLTRVRAGKADALAVARLDRLSRNTLDILTLTAASRRERWRLVILDLDFDTLTPEGEFTLTVFAGLAHQARRRIGESTRLALAEKRRRGERLGRPRLTPDSIVRRVVRQREAGRTWKAIADGLNRDRVPTVRGGRCWRVSSVQRVWQSAQYAATLKPAA